MPSAGLPRESEALQPVQPERLGPQVLGQLLLAQVLQGLLEQPGRPVPLARLGRLGLPGPLGRALPAQQGLGQPERREARQGPPGAQREASPARLPRQ